MRESTPIHDALWQEFYAPKWSNGEKWLAVATLLFFVIACIALVVAA